MELAELRMRRLNRLEASNAVSQLEAETARLQAKTAKCKVTLLKAIVEQEIEATLEDRQVAEGKLKLEQRLVKKGYATRMPSESRIRQLADQLRTLRLILKQ